MDETLIHSVFLNEMQSLIQADGADDKEAYQLMRKFQQNADLFLQEKGHGNIAVFYRPGLHRFLYKLSEMCEVILWTAADRSYAKPLLDHIDPSGNLLPYRLFREHCVKKGNVKCAKDLELLGRDMRRVVLIDNSPKAAETSPKNAYLIKDFFGDPSDQCLERAWQFLTELNLLNDIRQSLEMMLDLNMLDLNTPDDILDLNAPNVEIHKENDHPKKDGKKDHFNIKNKKKESKNRKKKNRKKKNKKKKNKINKEKINKDKINKHEDIDTNGGIYGEYYWSTATKKNSFKWQAR